MNSQHNEMITQFKKFKVNIRRV